jgi:hypothetical protein
VRPLNSIVRPLVKSSAIAWATFKAVALTYAMWVAVALAFAGLSEIGARVFESQSMAEFAALRAASRFWTAWWFLIFGVISTPLWFVLFIWFTRRFVLHGYRLVATGYFLVAMGALGVLGSLAYYFVANISANPSGAVLNSALAVLTILIGVALSRSRGKEA